MTEFSFEPANDRNMASMTSAQRALIRALSDEVIYGGHQPEMWASFQPEEGVDPLKVFFCPVSTHTVVGKFKIATDGRIFDREGVGEDFLK
jgi:hypothetical protein